MAHVTLESFTLMEFKLPHPFVLLLSGVALAAALTWVVPAGRYERRADAATGRDVVVPGSYARVEQAPVRPMAALLSVPCENLGQDKYRSEDV